jgi:hypothetical protein
MTDSLLFNSGSQGITGSLSVSGAASFNSAATFVGSVSKEVVIGSATTTDYFLLSAGQLFIRTNNSNASSNTGLVLQSGNSNNYDAQIFINGNDINSTSVIQFKTSDNGSLTTRAQINNASMSINLPVSITGSLTVTGSMSITGSSIILKDLPTSEPATSGQLWVSGSAGSNSKFICIRN